jgi:hypothetical protein
MRLERLTMPSRHAASAALSAGSGRRDGQRLVDLVEQRLAVERLGEIAEDAASRRLHRIGDSSRGR